MPSVVKSFCFPEWSLSFFLPNKDETCCPSQKKETNVLPIPKEVNKLNIKGGNVLSIPPPPPHPNKRKKNMLPVAFPIPLLHTPLHLWLFGCFSSWIKL